MVYILSNSEIERMKKLQKELEKETVEIIEKHLYQYLKQFPIKLKDLDKIIKTIFTDTISLDRAIYQIWENNKKDMFINAIKKFI